MNPHTNTAAPDGEDRIDWISLYKETPDSALEQAGLSERSYTSPAILLRELTGTALVRLHSLQTTTALKLSLDSCAILLPEHVNECLGHDPVVICLAPREWLLVSEFLGPSRLFAQVYSAVDCQHTAVLDLTAAFTIFRLSGPGAPWLLQKLCGLDLQHLAAGESIATRTRLQQVAVTLHYHRPAGLGSEFAFDLIVERSIAHYVWLLLSASAPHAEELAQLYGNPP